MSTMADVAVERLAGVSKDPKYQTSHQWRRVRSTSPTPMNVQEVARATPGGRTVCFAESPDKEGFGSFATKVAMPRTASALRMSWALRGPHGAAAPRNYENFRSRRAGKYIVIKVLAFVIYRFCIRSTRNTCRVIGRRIKKLPESKSRH